jgi:hypothetical protein
MRRGTVGTITGAIALVALAVPVGAASGKGLPSGAEPGTGVESTNGEDRFVALGTNTGTMVQRISQDTGEVIEYRHLSERLNVPGVALDGSASGLSADGRMLVLSPPFRLGQSKTELTVLDAHKLREEDRVELDGAFAVDAISPDGSRIYLIEYLSPRDFAEYRVRAYNLDRGRLAPNPIIDPEESGEEMYGVPLTRATSPDGRWAYTLYTGPRENFIHALDTQRAAAVCIDLHDVDEGALFRSDLRVAPDGQTLQVTRRGEALATVDTRSFDVTYPSPVSGAREESADEGESGHPWVLIGAGVLALGAALILMRRHAAPAG